MQQAAKRWVSDVQEISESLGTADPYLYINYAARFQDPLCSYGPKSVEFLKRMARKYDPRGVFQQLVPGGFKIDNAC
jgi:hypothetical protein